jgi:hypothetical protein
VLAYRFLLLEVNFIYIYICICHMCVFKIISNIGLFWHKKFSEEYLFSFSSVFGGGFVLPIALDACGGFQSNYRSFR